MPQTKFSAQADSVFLQGRQWKGGRLFRPGSSNSSNKITAHDKD
jgi:hypothetical protein